MAEATTISCSRNKGATFVETKQPLCLSIFTGNYLAWSKVLVFFRASRANKCCAHLSASTQLIAFHLCTLCVWLQISESLCVYLSCVPDPTNHQLASYLDRLAYWMNACMKERMNEWMDAESCMNLWRPLLPEIIWMLQLNIVRSQTKRANTSGLPRRWPL